MLFPPQVFDEPAYMQFEPAADTAWPLPREHEATDPHYVTKHPYVCNLSLTDRYMDLSQKSRISHRMATANITHAIRISRAAKLTQSRIDFAMVMLL